jgi:membrane protein required for colicin V production
MPCRNKYITGSALKKFLCSPALHDSSRYLARTISKSCCWCRSAKRLTKAEVTMNGLDWILAGIFFFSVIRGFWRGAISQLFGLAGILAGFLLSAHYYESVAARLVQVFPTVPQPQMISFGIIFVLGWFCLSCIGYWISSAFQRSGIRWLDRLLGAGVGTGKAFIFAAILISFLTFFLPTDSTILHHSRFAPHIQGVAQLLIKATPPRAEQLFEKKRQELKRYWLNPKEHPAPPNTMQRVYL